MTDIVLYSIIILLLIIIAILMIRLIRQAKQLKSFTEQLSEIRTENQNRLVNVDSFGKGYVGLAKELQQYVEDEKRLIEKAEEDRQSVNMMVAGISHDFRTPLTAATGYLQMVTESGELSGKNAEYVDTALNKMKYLRDLSDEFFTLSLVNSSDKRDITVISVKRIFEEVTLGQYDWIQNRGLNFSADIGDDACEIRAEEIDMIRLFENLYSNARKYADSCIKVSLEKRGGEIRLGIINDSAVLTASDISDIFKPFHRAASGEAEGSGLGLFIAKRIVEKYGGEIDASVNDGMFEIRLKWNISK